MKKLVRESLNESMIITDPIKVKNFYDSHRKGFYLVKAETEYKKGYAFDGDEANYTDVENGEFIMFDPENSESLYNYLANKFGEWTGDNADEWSEYVVIDTTGDEEEIYSW